MDEKVKDQDVLLVKTKDENSLKVVAGMDDKGKLKTVPPQKEHEKEFMKIDKHSNVLENFFSNFLRQYKDPTHFNFFKVSAENVKEPLQQGQVQPTEKQEQKQVEEAQKKGKGIRR